MKPIKSIRADLQRPAGGWTVGFGTLSMIFVMAGLVLVNVVPHWLGTFGMFAFLSVHVMWGMAGYYPGKV